MTATTRPDPYSPLPIVYLHQRRAPLVQALHYPATTRREGSVWGRGYACGKADGIGLRSLAVLGYGLLTGVGGFLLGWWMR